MLISWVGDLKDALLDIYPAMDSQDALCLAINGMSDILSDDVNDTFRYNMAQWMQQYFQVSSSIIGSAVIAYQDGIKGSTCN